MSAISTITRAGRHALLDASGAVVSEHNDADEAYERLRSLPAGTYTLRVADKRIVTVDAAPAPVPVPAPPAPVPAPPTPPAPTPTPPAPVAGRQGKLDTKPVTQAIVGASRTFTVGPNQQHADLDGVPWATLGAGDVVNVFHRAEPYRHKIALRGRGTAADPIVINGVTDSQGNRPVLDFAGARTASGCSGIFGAVPEYGESLGGIVIKRGPEDDYHTYKPAHIRVQNLKLQGAKKGASYVTLAGQTVTYGAAAGIYLHVGDDIELVNVESTDNGFGVFTMAKDEMLSQACSRLLVRNSRILGNGVPGSWFEHNLYIQADSPVIEGNFIGKVMEGSLGSSFKDRSARLILRHNHIEASARAIDLVHSEEQAQGIAALPYYGRDYVYGNEIDNLGAYEAIHYGGDNRGEQDGGALFTPPMPYRAQLMFWGNRVRHVTSDWRNIAFGLSTAETVCEAWDNEMSFGGASQNHFMLEYAGRLRLRNNVITGPVQRSGRDGATAAHWSITDVQALPQDDFLQTLIGAT